MGTYRLVTRVGLPRVLGLVDLGEIGGGGGRGQGEGHLEWFTPAAFPDALPVYVYHRISNMSSRFELEHMLCPCREVRETFLPAVFSSLCRLADRSD